MHKYVLLDFLAEHDRTAPADSKEPEDYRITHLKEFLATEEIRMMSDNEDISVAKFYEFLGKKYDPKRYDLTPLLITQNLAEFHLVKPGVTYQGIALKAVSTTDTARSKQALRRTQPVYFIDKTKTVKYTTNSEEKGKNIPFAAIAGLVEAVKQLNRRSEVLQVDLKPVVDVIEGYHQSTPTFRASKVFDAFLRHEKPAVARKPANAATNSKVLDRKAAIPDKESKQSIKKDWMTVFGGKRLLSHLVRDYLDARDEVSFSNIHPHTRMDDQSWAETLIKAGYSRELLARAGIPWHYDFRINEQNYQRLYLSLSKLDPKGDALLGISAWGLICASGDVGAIDKLIKDNFIGAETKTFKGFLPLDYALLSGSIDAVQCVLTIPGIEKQIKAEADAILKWAARHATAPVVACLRQFAREHDIALPVTNDIISAADSNQDAVAVRQVLLNGQPAGEKKAEAKAGNDDEQKLSPADWKKRLAEFKFDPGLLAEITGDSEQKREKYSVRSYQKLYRVTQLGYNICHLWQVLCVSGEPRAIQYLIDNKLIDSTTTSRNDSRLRPLDYTALSGSIDALRLILTIPGIDPRKHNSGGWSIVRYGFESGSLAMAKFVLALPGMTPEHRSEAVWGGITSGAMDVAEFALTLRGEAFIGPIANGRNILHEASVMMPAKGVALLRLWLHNRGTPLDPNTQNKHKHDAFWFAKSTLHEPDKVEKVLRMTVEQLKDYVAKTSARSSKTPRR